MAVITYSQAHGVMLLPDGFEIHGLWAGNGKGKNNPDAQSIKCLGPLPRGKYHICKPVSHARLGPFAMQLIPHENNDMFGRDDFWIHGASQNKQRYGQESMGCIIASRDVRGKLWATGCTELEVIK